MHIQFRYFEYTKAKQKYVYRHPIIPLVRKCMKAILQSVCISNVCYVLDKFTCSVYSFTSKLRVFSEFWGKVWSLSIIV